mmetsp:Transcript_23234/g.50476  ORF Transcript_23234/g.50476 Transcript_23234/m.50476 type:complete len:921 (-) Transcript_23234:71-2833(-)
MSDNFPSPPPQQQPQHKKKSPNQTESSFQSGIPSSSSSSLEKKKKQRPSRNDKDLLSLKQRVAERAAQIDRLSIDPQEQRQADNNDVPSFFLIDSGVSITTSPSARPQWFSRKQQPKREQEEEEEDVGSGDLESLRRPLLIPSLLESHDSLLDNQVSSYLPPGRMTSGNNKNSSSLPQKDGAFSDQPLGLRHRDVLASSSSEHEIQFERESPYRDDHNGSSNDGNDTDTSSTPSHHVHRHVPWYKNPYQRMAMVSNFGTSYNVVNISLVLPIIEQVLLERLQQPTSSQDASGVASSLLAGMIIGQLMGGALGDSRLGLAGSLRLVMVLQIAASLGSALLVRIPTNNSNDNNNTSGVADQVYATLSLWRFVLGVGAGAVYPLAACLSVEQPGLGRGVDHHCPPMSSHRDNHHGEDNSNDGQDEEGQELFHDEGEEEEENQASRRNPHHAQRDNATVTTTTTNNVAALKRVVRTFAVQGIGFWCCPALAWPLLKCPGISLNTTWRLLLGVGALPGISLLFLQWQLYRKDLQEQEAHKRQLLQGNQQLQQNPSVGESPRPTDPLPSPHGQSSGLRRSTADEHDINNDDNVGVAAENEFLRQDSDGEVGTFLDSAPDLSSDGCYGESEPPAIKHGWWASLWLEQDLCRKLTGTAVTWFLFDVLFYGNTLFQPIVVEAAFGPVPESNDAELLGDAQGDVTLLQRTARDSLLLTSMALPGYFVAGAILGEKTCGKTQSVRFVMLQGFALMSILYLTIGVFWKELRHYPIVLVLVYGMTFFFANYGPNTTTFILPSLVYSAECRSTLNGLSAAAGKLGALTGATLFAPAAAKFGDATVMKLCAVIGFVAYVITLFFVRIQPPNASSDGSGDGSTRMIPYANQQHTASTLTLAASNTTKEEDQNQHSEEVEQHPDTEQRRPLASGSLT